MMRFGDAPTAIAAITIKPDGARSIVCYRDPAAFSREDTISLQQYPAKVLLVDGHQPSLSIRLVEEARELGTPSILDAGSINGGTQQLYDKVDYLVASSKFAYQQTGSSDTETALKAMREFAPFTAITQGPVGIYWQTQDSSEIFHMKAFKVDAVDTTGAGDAFHEAFALGIAQDIPMLDNIRRAAACGALTCLKMGARNGLPTKREVESLFRDATGTPLSR
ncbi:MAG: sulfofructose kinase [Lentimonas sp.]|jgi:sulfofructose kinase